MSNAPNLVPCPKSCPTSQIYPESVHLQVRSQDACTVSTQRLESQVQKLVDAAQISFAERALLYDQNQMLTIMNNEAKVRRSIRSVVLGKAKVMSFEEIEVVRAACAAKEFIKGKGKRGRKRGRKRRSAALEVEEEDPEPGLACVAKGVIKGGGKRRRKRESAAQDVDELEPETPQIIEAPWRAPVAYMG